MMRLDACADGVTAAVVPQISATRSSRFMRLS
jgi:hypothetical protein